MSKLPGVWGVTVAGTAELASCRLGPEDAHREMVGRENAKAGLMCLAGAGSCMG